MENYMKSTVKTFKQTDGYKQHYRVWEKKRNEDVVVLLHGGISHSEWQAPLATHLIANAELSFVALDRRGSGLNKVERGNLVSKDREIKDVVDFLKKLREDYKYIHLAGWCFGGQVATVIAAELEKEDILTSFSMIAPGFSYTERYSDVLKMSNHTASEIVKEFNLKPEKSYPYVPVPLQPIDFTEQESFHHFIKSDPLCLQNVSERTYEVWYELAELAINSLSSISTPPTLVIFGANDRLVDNKKVETLIRNNIKTDYLKFESVDAGHAIQFDEPEKLAKLLSSFVIDSSRRVLN